MLDGGLLEEAPGYSEHVSRVFFVQKGGKPGEEVKVRLVADFCGINRKLQRPEHPLENAWGIIKRLNPRHRFFAAIDITSGYSQIPLAEESRDLFTIITPYGKFRPTVLPQGTSISPEIFDIGTAPEIRNTPDAWKNPDHILGRGIELEDLDAMRRIFSVCRKRGIKLSPSKLQIGRRINWGGVIVESIGQADGENDVFISADEQKVADFLDIARPTTKREVQQICGMAAQLKKFAPGLQIRYPGMQKLCAANVKFMWSGDLDKELEDLKEALKNNVKISPIDTEKNLILVIDAAPTVGCSYILLQMKTDDPADGFSFISMDSSNFRKGQLSLCPFEAECAGLRYAVRKENHYVAACPEVLVLTDCKTLGSTHAKPLENILKKLCLI